MVKQSDEKSQEKGSVFHHIPPFFSRDLLLQVLLGICGAALIPLLLYLTSSKLFSQCDTSLFTYLVFAGYCFIGAIFSEALLKSLAKRLDLQKFEQKLKNQEERLSQTTEKAEEAQKFIESKLNEDSENVANDVGDPITLNHEALEKGFSSATNEKVNLGPMNSGKDLEDAKSVLNELKNPKYTDRSVNGLAKKTGLSRDKVILVLNILSQYNLVRKVQWYGNTFYRLTDSGRNSEISDTL